MDDMKALSEAATQGEWEGHLGALNADHANRGYYEIAEFHAEKYEGKGEDEFNAAFIAALVNAYRAGTIHTTADLEAAVRAARDDALRDAEKRARTAFHKTENFYAVLSAINPKDTAP